MSHREDENGESFIESGQPHPLYIPHVISTILRNLTASTLRACRLVNLQYNDEACKQLAGCSSAIFDHEFKLMDYMRIFVKNLKDDQNEIRFRPLRHKEFVFKYYPKYYPEKVEEFFKIFGSQICNLHYETHLTPLQCEVPWVHMGDVWKCNHLTNLRTLSLEIKWGFPISLFSDLENKIELSSVKELALNILVTELDVTRATNFLGQLLNIIPNVERIRVPPNKRFLDDFSNVILARTIVYSPSSLRYLRKLDFCMSLNHTEIVLVTAKKLQLQTLILDLDHFSISPQQNYNPRSQLHDLQVFFAELSNTLTELHLNFPSCPLHFLQTFRFSSCMRSLKHFALSNYFGSQNILIDVSKKSVINMWNVVFNDKIALSESNLEFESESEKI